MEPTNIFKKNASYPIRVCTEMQEFALKFNFNTCNIIDHNIF